ncbi:MAG: biotin--[acetyl-CoA-carboxylase] ligase [Vicinamibacterales bacterium]
MFEPLPEDLADAIAAAGESLGTFARLRYRAEVESTNDLALMLAAAGDSEGTAVIADVQRAGRGRRGRAWHSPAGAGLYLSIVVEPPQRAGSLPLVTLAAGVAVAVAIRQATALPVELKWPNDVVIGRPWRKLGGVLSEAASTGSSVLAIVIGIGLNLQQAQYPRELAGRATSLEAELGRPVSRAVIVVEILRQMRAIMHRLRDDDAARLCAEWRQLGAAGLGGHVCWRENGQDRRGRAVDIAADGALLVDVGDGRVERVIAGEVNWESLPRG